MKRFLMIVTIAMLGMVLAACGGSNAEPAATATPASDAQAGEETPAVDLTVEMHDMYFGEDRNNVENPPVWTLNAGEEVGIELQNLGNLEHNWAIVNDGAVIEGIYTPEQEDKLYWESDVLSAGTEQIFTFTVPSTPGEYLVICTVAGHYPAMQGRLIVE